MKTKLLCLLIAAVLAPVFLQAEEGGSGRYGPGGLSSMYDFPGTNPGGTAVVPQMNYYIGDTGSSRSLPIGAQIRNDVDVTAFAAVLVLVGSLDNPVLGGAFSMGVVVPWVSVEVSSKSTLGPLSVRDVDHSDAFGDITLLPAMIGWKRGLNNYSAQVNVTMPTGEYDKNALANTGKNFWTVQPSVGFHRLNPQTGRAFTAFAGMEFNTTNDDTDYKSGETFHVEATFYQRFPAADGATWGLGVNGFFFQQITGDSGSGAVLGDYKGRTYGAGPALAWEKTDQNGTFIFAELKWLPEFAVENRTQGNSFWLKIGAAW